MIPNCPQTHTARDLKGASSYLSNKNPSVHKMDQTTKDARLQLCKTVLARIYKLVKGIPAVII